MNNQLRQEIELLEAVIRDAFPLEPVPPPDAEMLKKSGDEPECYQYLGDKRWADVQPEPLLLRHRWCLICLPCDYLKYYVPSYLCAVLNTFDPDLDLTEGRIDFAWWPLCEILTITLMGGDLANEMNGQQRKCCTEFIGFVARYMRCVQLKECTLLEHIDRFLADGGFDAEVGGGAERPPC